jgi:serralysin
MATSQIIRLTDAIPNQAQLKLFSTPVDATKGLSIAFDFFSYGGSGGASGGTGGDGFSFSFINGSQDPLQIKAGGFGGSLGYAQSSATNLLSGLTGGYLGVGFDEFGNFSSGTEGRVGGNPGGKVPDSVAVRGSQASSYKFLTGTQTLPFSLDVPGSQGTQTNSLKHAKINLSPIGQLTVQIDSNSNGQFEPNETLINYNVITQGQNGALPATFRFGFAGSTGVATNIHEVGDFSVTTFDGTPLAGSFSNDQIVSGGSGKTGDPLTGGTGNDIIVSGTGGDTLTGGTGGDRFLFSGVSKAAALKTSLLRKPDKITDFIQAQGDRFQLDFDNNLTTIDLPKGLANAGTIKKARNLTEAAEFAYADKNQKKRGNQALKVNEAVFFKFGKRSYVSVNDNKAPFSAKTDLVADVTGIQYKLGDAKQGSLVSGNYFA